MFPIEVSSRIMVPSELYSLAGEDNGVTFGGKVTVGAGVGDGLGDGEGEGLAEGEENKPFGTITKIAAITTATIAITPTKIIIFLFLAFDCGLSFPH